MSADSHFDLRDSDIRSRMRLSGSYGGGFSSWRVSSRSGHGPLPMPLPRPYVSVMLGHSEFYVDSRYQNLKPVGRGAYGLVVSADDTLTGRRVAIKRTSRMFADLIDAKRILREIMLLCHLGKHDNIVEVLDMMTTPPDCEDFHTLYIVMSLFECDMERIITSTQVLSEQHVQYFTYQVLRGLKFMHSAKVLHRDLKPSNLLVNSNCDLSICDFGLSRGISDTGDTKLTEYVVTRWYRAPELLCESEIYGSPVDVWGVGCLLAELLSRKIMFKGNSTREQLQLIIEKLGTPADDEMTGIHSPLVIETIKRMGAGKTPPTLAEQFPGASPLAVDLLSRLLTFDQIKRCTVDEALAHPYLCYMHARAQEPVCSTPFDWEFERSYPDEMPQELLQRIILTEIVKLRAVKAKQLVAEIEAREAAMAAAVAQNTGSRGTLATGEINAAPADEPASLPPISKRHSAVPTATAAAAAVAAATPAAAFDGSNTGSGFGRTRHRRARDDSCAMDEAAAVGSPKQGLLPSPDSTECATKAQAAPLSQKPTVRHYSS